MRLIFNTILSVCLFLCIQNINAGQIDDNTKFTISVKPDSVYIGESYALLMELEVSKDIKAEIFPADDSLKKTVEIMSISVPDSIVTPEGNTRYSWKYNLISFEEGFHIIPPFRAAIEKNGVKDTIFSNGVYIAVSLLPHNDEVVMHDVKPIFQVPVTFKEVLPWIAGAVGLILIILLLIYVIRQIQSKKPVFGIPKPILPPHLVAIRELDKLRQENLWQEGMVKEYHTRLTDILRDYLDNRFFMSSKEQVTKEIMSSLRDTGFENNTLLNRLEEVFILADMVKFAKAIPMADENEKVLLNAYFFVNNTEPEPEATVEKQDSEQNKTE